MSRIGKAQIAIPTGVEIKVSSENVVSVKGPKGELQQELKSGFKVEIKDGILTIARPNEEKQSKALHGLYRSLINNNVIGVKDGHTTKQELVGVGYKASNIGQILDLSVGYSHRIMLEIPKEVKITTITEKGQNPTIILESADKQLVGQIAAKIRSFRTPEPYKGKGIRFSGEQLRRKAGKSASKK
ncbi:MAG: 50S ribosomal protein L6 [Bacteroidetes bacterium]|nr:50S ribosomal protein L6 [Bacteroidota bacterium]